jgi:hypothetical protein
VFFLGWLPQGMTPSIAGYYIDAYSQSLVRVRSIPGHPDRFHVIGCEPTSPTIQWVGTLYCLARNEERQKVRLQRKMTIGHNDLKGSWHKSQRMICFENGKRWKWLWCHSSQFS